MRVRQEGRAALSAMAAMAGTGFASGRMIALCFGRLGEKAWFAIILACALVSAATGAAARTGKRDFNEAARFPPWLWLPLPALLAALSLARAVELGALAFPIRRGGIAGVLLILPTALAALRRPGNVLPKLGTASALAALSIYVAAALDPRPVRVFLRAGSTLPREGTAIEAALAATLYAAINACAASPVVRAIRPKRARPLGVALLTGATLGAILCAANAALLRGGPALLFQAEPLTLLTARWGINGFWLCAGFGLLCAAASLASALCALADGVRETAARRRCSVHSRAIGRKGC